MSGVADFSSGGSALASTEWDRDGAGPLPPLLVLCGSFQVAGNAAVNNVATFDPSTGQWATLASGCPSTVKAVAAGPNGELVIGGNFATIAGVTVNSVAAWNGTAWTPLGNGIAAGASGEIQALTFMPNGDLIAAGTFANGAGVGAKNIARWNGSSWSSLGTGLDTTVMSLATLANGNLVGGGYFVSAGGVPMSRIAQWNGTTWSPLGSGVAAGSAQTSVQSLLPLPNGDLIVGGYFGTAGGIATPNLARWDGTAWSSVGGGANDRVRALTISNTGDLIAGGNFSTIGGVAASRIARWDGSAWHSLQNGISGASSSWSWEVACVTPLSSGALIAGGYFDTAGNTATKGVASWNGSTWEALSPGSSGSVHVFGRLANQDLVVGGNFARLAGVDVANIARWNGSKWSPLGAGFPGPTLTVRCLTTLANGDLLAGGFLFGGTPGAFIRGLARWNGTTWSPVGAGIGFAGGDNTVHALLELPSGDVLVGGSFTQIDGLPIQHIARWNGTTWSAVGASGNGAVRALVLMPNGDVVAGGDFFSIGGIVCSHVARWNGSTWSAMGAGFNSRCRKLLVRSNGELLAAGDMTVSGTGWPQRIARWNGSSWERLGEGTNGPIHDVATLPNGDLVATGRFSTADDLPANRIARWDGYGWTALAGGLIGNSTTASGYALHISADGELLVGGEFHLANGAVSMAMARYVSTCRATATTVGAGCVGGGPGPLVATSLPWIGATQQSVATAVPSGAVAVSVRGVGPVALPLDTVFAPAGVGCTLHVAPDVLELHLPINGTVTTSLEVPATLALVGVQWREQLVTFEWFGNGALATVGATNALRFTVGAF